MNSEKPVTVLKKKKTKTKRKQPKKKQNPERKKTVHLKGQGRQTHSIMLSESKEKFHCSTRDDTCHILANLLWL